MVITRLEVMADIIVVLMLPKVGLNVLGVMTNDKPKKGKASDFDLNDYWAVY